MKFRGNSNPFIAFVAAAGLCIPAFAEPVVKYHEVEFDLAQVSIQRLGDLGVPVDHIDTDGKILVIPVSDYDLDALKREKIPYRLLIPDLANYIEMRNIRAKLAPPEPPDPTLQAPDNFKHGSMGGYLTFAQVVAELAEMRTKFPNLVSERFEIGKTAENRSIWAIRISNTPNEENPAKRRIAYNTLTHPREPMAMMSMFWFLWTVLESYATDATIRNMVNNIELYYIPVVNPDGYEYNRSTNINGGGLWRKNRRTNSDGTRGVDVNRNYSVNWGNNAGSSPTPSSDTYRGTDPISELESQAVSKFYLRIKPLITSNYHTYANKILHPYGVGTSQPSNMAPYTALCTEMTRANRWEYGRVPPTIGYQAAGIEIDWGHDVLKSIAVNPEQGSTAEGGFWPPESRIDQMAQNALDMNMAMMRYVMTIPVPVAPKQVAPNFAVKVGSANGLWNVQYQLEDTRGDWFLSVTDLRGKEYKNVRLSPAEKSVSLSQRELSGSMYLANIKQCADGACRSVHQQKLVATK